MRSTEHHLLQHVRTLLSKISPPQLPYMADRVDDKAPLLQPCNDTYTDSSGGRSEGKRQVVSSLVSGDEARSPGGNNDGKGNRAKLDDASPEKAPSAIASGSVNLICFVMVLDLMTITVQMPSMPSVFEAHGMDLRWQGWVASAYGVVSFLLAPVLGRASDTFGRVAMLELSAAGSLIGAVGCLYAPDKWSFIAARTLPALVQCSMPVSQAYLVDISEGSAERSKNLGMLGAAFGVSLILGPPLGGLVADYNPSLPFVLSILEGVILLGTLRFLLPEPTAKKPKDRKDSGADDTGKGKRLEMFRGPRGRQMLWGFHDRFLVVLAAGVFHTSLASFFTTVLEFPPGRVGMLLAFIGLVSALTNVFLVGMLTRLFAETPLLATALGEMGAGWAMWSGVGASIPSILTALAVIGVGWNVFQTVNKAALAKNTPPELMGTMMGMSEALETLARTAAGPLSGYLIHEWGIRGLSLCCSAGMLYLAGALVVRAGVASSSWSSPVARTKEKNGTGDIGDPDAFKRKAE